MKGFGIEIKNNLLDPKHVEGMGTAVWLYMWLLDHVTSVDEKGIGKVLGGKPVKFPDVEKELGMSADSYTRWIDKLLEYPYIQAIRTPHGISFRVYKTHKRFRKNAERFRTNAEGILDSAETRNVSKTVSEDSTKTIAEQSSAPYPKVDSFFSKDKEKYDAVPMTLPEFILLCRSSRHRFVRLIGEYADDRRPTASTRGQWKEFGRRNFRAAQKIAPYTDKQLGAAMEKLLTDVKSESNPKGFITKWSLETLVKYLDEV